jgi:hypothetical protein
MYRQHEDDPASYLDEAAAYLGADYRRKERGDEDDKER